MRIIYASRSGKAGPAPLWSIAVKLALLLLSAAIVLAVMLIGLFIVLPVMLVGGIALSFYLRRKSRQARRAAPETGVIDAEYTVIEHDRR
ncbi:hypothetical protein [Microvirga sp. TS319]|uniref:hypothetical protein n=1 Tax=Microvirga sp. TS319 TaxID=3241165 RepID=UPI00351A3274